MMKKLLAILLSITLVFSLCSFAYADEEYIPEGEITTPEYDGYNPEEDGEYQPFEDYDGMNEEGNYEPQDTYYNGRLVALNENVDIREIRTVTLTSGDTNHTATVDSKGYFSLMLPDTNETMTVSIPNEKFVVLPNEPVDNNKIFVSLSQDSSKDIYVGIRSNITGSVTNSDGTAKIADAAVTCYYRATESDEWSLWMGNEFSSNANRTTDENGLFSYAITSGQYRFVIKADGYNSYDSYEREYMTGISPVEETTAVTFHLTAEKQMSLVSVTPEQGGTLAPDGSIKIVFSHPVSKSVVSNYENLRLDRVSTQNYVPFVATVNGNEVTIKPEARLMEGQKYNIIITPKITATDGSTLNIDRIITFTCQSASSTSADDAVDTEDKNAADDITGHWSQQFMQRLIDLDIIDGTQADGIIKYYPDKELTRAEFAKYIVMSQGIETATEATGTFMDGDNIPFDLRPYVYGAYNAGIIQGSQEDDGLYFLPSATITRAEIITILGRIIGDTSDAPLDFADAADVPDWALPYVAGCVEKGYVNGDNDTGVMLLRPLDNVTRCEAATIISKMLDDK